jgi:hypothetical protein
VLISASNYEIFPAPDFEEHYPVSAVLMRYHCISVAASLVVYSVPAENGYFSKII